VHDHIARVEARQRDGRSGVDDLRERSRRLAARVEGLAADDPGRARLAAAIRSIDEDLRYVSPAEGSEAAELEDRMAAGLAVLEDVVARDMDAGEVQEAVDVSGRVAADLALRRSLRTERAAGRSRAVEDEG
jgi:hypothetical protein